MGVNCSLDMNDNPENAFSDVESDISSQCFDDSDVGKTGVRGVFSASTFSIKNLLQSGKAMLTSSSEAESMDGKSSTGDFNDENMETFEQLWEDCFDLSELIDRTRNRVLQYMEGLNREGYSTEEKQRCIELITYISAALEHFAFDEVTHGLQSDVFTTDGLIGNEQKLESYFDETRQVDEGLVKSMNESFDLFILSVKMKNKNLTEDAFRLWSRMFQIHTDVHVIGRKFAALVSADPESISCDDDKWKILNHLVYFVRKVQYKSRERAHILLAKIAALRMELNKNNGNKSYMNIRSKVR